MIRFRHAAAAFLLAASLGSVAAQGLALQPALDAALPWADSPQGVKTTAPLLLNATTIVPTGATVRIFYVTPASSDNSDGPLLIHHSAVKEDAYSRQGSGSGGETEKGGGGTIDLAVRAAHQTVWPNIASFRAALNLLNSADLRVVYQAPGGTGLSDQPLNPIDGLLLEEKEGTILVCGVVKNSSADGAGFAPGDRIDSLNGASLHGTLAAFRDAYAEARDASTIAKPKPYLLHVHRGDKDLDLMLRPPLSLGGSLLDQ